MRCGSERRTRWVFIASALVWCCAGTAHVAADYIYALGSDDSGASCLWRFTPGGTYLGNIAPSNNYSHVLSPGDGYVYGIDAVSGDFTRMNADGTDKTLIDITPNPSSTMGGPVVACASDGAGGILMAPLGFAYEPRTITRYGPDGTLLATYTGMQHTGGVAGDYDDGHVFAVSRAGWDDGLYSFPWEGGGRTTVSPSTGIVAVDMTIDRENDVLFLLTYGATSCTVERYGYGGGHLGTITLDKGLAVSLEYDASSGYLFAGHRGNATVDGWARAVDLNGNIIQDYIAPGMHHVDAVTLYSIPEPATGLLVFAVGCLSVRRRRAVAHRG